MLHKSLQALHTKQQVIDRTKEELIRAIIRYRELAARFGWERARDYLAKTKTDFETVVRDTLNDISCWLV